MSKNMVDNSGAGKIVGIGELLWDMLPDGKQLGGAPVNFAYHVSQFGLNGIAVSAVGRDALGEEMEAALRDKNIVSKLERVDAPTGIVDVKIDAFGVPLYDIKKNVAWDNIPFSGQLEDLASETVAVCFGSLAQRNDVSRETINAFLDAMPTGPGYYRIFDINLRQDFYDRDIVCNSLNKCNILKINEEELEEVSRILGYAGCDTKEKCRNLISDYDLEILILTCGAFGSYVFTPYEDSFVETPKVVVADTVGAGDSFTATFVASVLKGRSIKDAHKLAVEVSAFVCSCNGATPEIPCGIIDRCK